MKGKIKESKIDQAFSIWIRNRDKVCQFPLRDNDHHSSVLQCSHFYGRGARSVRWDPENCDGICSRHHQFLEGRKNAEYLWWKKKQLGSEKFTALRNRYVKIKQWSQLEKVKLLEALNVGNNSV